MRVNKINNERLECIVNSSPKRVFNVKPLSKSMLILCMTIAASGCGIGSDDADSHNGVTEYIIDEGPNLATPNAGDEQFSSLRQEGKYWVNAQNEIVSLRGINIGNWLILEPWMWSQVDGGFHDQCSLEAKLTERFGADEKERLMKVYRDNYITDRDWDIMHQAGFNLIRLPFIHHLIEDANNPKTLRDDAWVYLDKAIDEAKQRNMYVILDLHGAAGGQGWEHHTGCQNKNEFWGGDQNNPNLALAADNQDRTKWLWQQIAARYKDEPVVAAYGLLNEPWGTDPDTMASVTKEIYAAVREVDNDKIVMLHGAQSGIDAYGKPADNGLSNVAFEMHFYPGIFDDLGISYKTQRDWLTCGLFSDAGVCEWDNKITAVDTPFLIGEIQPWTGLGELGGKISRATYDVYNDLGWAATAWSYKIMSTNGGQGNGSWGLVTNKGDRLLAKASTWACPGWQTSFADGCEQGTKVVTPTSAGGTYYLIIKTGSGRWGTPDPYTVDIRYDDVQLIAQSTQQNVLQDSGFDGGSAWVEWSATNGSPNEDDLLVDTSFSAEDGGTALRISVKDTSEFANGGVYQAVELAAGESYLLTGSFNDAGSANTWAEIYLLPAAPTNGHDVNNAAIHSINIEHSSIEEIEDFFTLTSTIDYDIQQDVIDNLSAATPPVIFDLPIRPVDLSLIEYEDTNTIELTWRAVDGAKYNVYRSGMTGGNYEMIAEGVETSFYTDATKPADQTGFYVVTATNATDESFYSKEVASAFMAVTLPGTIQVENWVTMEGFQLENAQDDGGGNNLAHANPGDWAEYTIDVAQAGTYNIEARLATAAGSQGFQLFIGDQLLTTIGTPPTGGWQTWTSVFESATLPAGEHTLRLVAIDDEININWLKFTLAE